MVARMSFIVSVLLLVLMAVALAGASNVPDTETLCREHIFITGGGELVQWKEHVNGSIKCKLKNVTDMNVDLLCYPDREGIFYYMDYLGYRVIDDNRVVCLYKRKVY